MSIKEKNSGIRIQAKPVLDIPYAPGLIEFLRSDKNQRQKKLGAYEELPEFVQTEILIAPISYEDFSKRYTISPHVEKLLGYVHSRKRFEESSRDLLAAIRSRRELLLDSIPAGEIIELLVAQHGHLQEYALQTTLRDVGSAAENIIILEEMLGDQLLEECIQAGLIAERFKIETEVNALLLVENRKLGEYADRLEDSLSYIHFDRRDREIQLASPKVDVAIIDEMRARTNYVKDLLKMKSDEIYGISYFRRDS